MNGEKRKHTFYEYRQGFTIALLVLVTGFVLEWVSGGKGIGLPSWPMNLYIGLSFAFILFFVHRFYRELDIVKMLSRVPVSISSIVLFTLLTLVMGLTKQNEPGAAKFMQLTGLSHLRNSYVFLLSGMYLLTSLGLVLFRRMHPFNYKNAGFLLNHLGLWIIVLAGSLGAGDLKRVNIMVHEQESVWYGYGQNGYPVQLPFTIKLIDFDIDFFPPKLAFIENRTMTLSQDTEKKLPMIEKGIETQFGAWTVKVEEFMPFSRRDSLGVYYTSEDTLSYPAAFLKIRNSKSGEEKSGWISTGNIRTEPQFLNAGEKHSFAMTIPEARRYSSLLEVIRDGHVSDTTLLVVNKPVKAGGYNLYQTSYDERMGKWSEYSVLEAVRDPWLPVIYTGIFMVILGSLYLFTIGKTPKKTE